MAHPILWITGRQHYCSPVSRYCMCVCPFLFHASTAIEGLQLPLSMFRDHIPTHHSRKPPWGQATSPMQRPLPDNAQHTQETDIHASSGIRTHNPSKHAAAQPRLKTLRPPESVGLSVRSHGIFILVAD
jgi:hypothetical protein